MSTYVALTAPQLLDLRRNWIRDEWKDSPDFKGISHWNLANKRAFFTDPQLLGLDQYVWTEYHLQLDGVRSARYALRLNTGDDVTTAGAEADAELLFARMRLLRAECSDLMVNDPGFRKSLDEDKETLVSIQESIVSDRNFVMRRTGSATLPMHRG